METLFNKDQVERYKELGGEYVEKVLYDFVKENAEKY